MKEIKQVNGVHLMFNYIDEAGSFVTANSTQESWCTVSCYSVPEFEKRKLQNILASMKLKIGFNKNDEVKLKSIGESEFFNFLTDLASLNSKLFVVATDSYFNKEAIVLKNREDLLYRIQVNRDLMMYDESKNYLDVLYTRVANLPEQLFIQLQCQIKLVSSFVAKGIAYYIQRYPNSLSEFRWRYDAKEITKITDFEKSYQDILPAILQAFSIDTPMPKLDNCDYSPMKRYLTHTPEYLSEKFPELLGKECIDLGKVIGSDVKFIDSKTCPGIQVSDLLASGLRKLLRLEFNDNVKIAKAMGKLLVQSNFDAKPVDIVVFGEESELGKHVSYICNILFENSERFWKVNHV